MNENNKPLVLFNNVPATHMIVYITVIHNAKEFDLDVEPTDRIEDIKAKINNIMGFPVNLQRLVFAGKVLEEGNTLQDYSIQKESSIHLYIMPKGRVR